MSAPPVVPPTADRVRVERTHHGDVVVDEHEWLRDAEDPRVRELVDAENAWAAASTAHLEPLRERLFEEVRGRTQESDLSVPARDGAWWTYRRTVEGQQYGLLCRVPAGVGAGGSGWTPPVLPEDGSALPGEQVLLDGNVEAQRLGGEAFFALGAASVSPDGQLLAWSTDTTGDERFTLRVRDLVTGADLDVAIPGLGHGATWGSDSRTLLYSAVDEAWRPHEVRRHVVGESAPDGEGDAVVLREDDERYWLGVGRTRSGRYLVLSSGSKTTSEVWLLDAGGVDRAPGTELVSVAGRREGVEYQVDHAVLGAPGHLRDVLLVLHDDGAPDFELVRLSPADVGEGAHERWQVLVPHEEGRRLEDVDAFAGHVALSWRREALPRVAVLRVQPDGELSAPVEVASPTALASSGVASNPSFTAPLLRLSQTSWTTPTRVVDLDLSGGPSDGEVLLRRQTPVLGGYDAADYVEERTWATAPDGVRVPVSVVRRAAVAAAGQPAPGYLYGYGSYEVSLDPWFSVSRLSMLDRGVAFAVAHVRGGGEMGRHWYDDGKLTRKPNTFTDFVAAAEHLGATGTVDPSRLVASGGSAGGLLVGAALNLAPHLFAGVTAAVPFVDPLTTMLDESLPLTVPEQEEWGDPIRDAAAYALIKSYSPVENLPAEGAGAWRTWPRVLVTTSLHDTRVLYVEPFKWVARMRLRSGDGAPQVLLKTEVDGGHGGRSGRYEAWRERAFEDAWALDVLGLTDVEPTWSGIRS